MRIKGGKDSIALNIDENGRAQIRSVAIDDSEHLLHEGWSFVAAGSQTTANADTNMTILTLLTGNGVKVPHMFVRASVTGAAWLRIYEAPTIVNNTGTSVVTVYNRNRNSVNMSSVYDTKTNPNKINSVTFWDETDAAGANITLGDGTLIYPEQIGAGRSSAGITRGEDEFILKPATKYAFVLANLGATANTHNIILDWYED